MSFIHRSLFTKGGTNRKNPNNSKEIDWKEEKMRNPLIEFFLKLVIKETNRISIEGTIEKKGIQIAPNIYGTSKESKFLSIFSITKERVGSNSSKTPHVLSGSVLESLEIN